MITPAIREHFREQLGTIDALDIGCHEGFYSLALGRLGIPRVTGIDAREEILRRARFVAQAVGMDGIDYELGRV